VYEYSAALLLKNGGLYSFYDDSVTCFRARSIFAGFRLKIGCERFDFSAVSGYIQYVPEQQRYYAEK
jgi:hypothetical protein